jgi:hypothetical protein
MPDGFGLHQRPRAFKASTKNAWVSARCLKLLQPAGSPSFRELLARESRSRPRPRRRPREGVYVDLRRDPSPALGP